jgi:hypothetical protein
VHVVGGSKLERHNPSDTEVLIVSTWNNVQDTQSSPPWHHRSIALAVDRWRRSESRVRRAHEPGTHASGTGLITNLRDRPSLRNKRMADDTLVTPI